VALSAQDVHDKQFKLVRQSTGYDIDEVDGFLDEVEAEIARLTDELAAAQSALATAEQRTAEQRTAEQRTAEQQPTEPPASAAPTPGDGAGAAARILELAQRTADEYVAEARRTADTLVSEAEERARTAVAALEGQRAELEGRVTALRTFEAEVRTRLTGYFESQLRDLRSIAEPPGQ